MFENLTDKLERSFKILKGEGRITEINVAETVKEIRRALIDLTREAPAGTDVNAVGAGLLVPRTQVVPGGISPAGREAPQ
jgi:hypothetical protein